MSFFCLFLCFPRSLRGFIQMQVSYRVYIRLVQKVVQNECSFWNENPNKLIQK